MKTLWVSLFALGALVIAPSAEARVHHKAAHHKSNKAAEAESDAPHRHHWITPLRKDAPEPEAKTRHGKAHAAKGRHGKTAKAAKPGHAAKAHHKAKAAKPAHATKRKPHHDE